MEIINKLKNQDDISIIIEINDISNEENKKIYYKISKEILKNECKLISDMIEMCGDDNNNIKLDKGIEKELFEMIIDYMYYYSDNNNKYDFEKPIKGKFIDVANDYDKNLFGSVERNEDNSVSYLGKLNNINTQFVLIFLDYIGYTYMLDHIGAWIASEVIPKLNITELREFLNIENDFTPEEEAEIEKENSWINESD